jgi:hypothetical protein
VNNFMSTFFILGSMSQVHSINSLGRTSEIFTMCNNICINIECMFCDFIRNYIFICTTFLPAVQNRHPRHHIIVKWLVLKCYHWPKTHSPTHFSIVVTPHHSSCHYILSRWKLSFLIMGRLLFVAEYPSM